MHDALGLIATRNGHRPAIEQCVRLLDVRAALLEPPPEPRYLWEGLVEVGELVWLAGPGKAGKSLLALFLTCTALRGGGPLLGLDVAPVRQAVYVDGENRETTVRRRLHAAGVPLSVADRLRYGVARSLDLATDLGLETLSELAVGCELLVLDSLVALHRADEDSAGEVRALVTGIRRVGEQVGCTVLGLAHENRGGDLRGSLDWRNAADTTLELKRVDAGWRTLRIRDRRDGPDDVPARLFRFDAVDGRVILEEGAGSPRESAVEIAAGQLRAVLSENPNLTQSEAARKIGTTRDHGTFRKAWALARAEAHAARAGRGTPSTGVPAVPTSPDRGYSS